MADYTTLSAVKNYLHITSGVEDAALADSVSCASAMIDTYCGRWFTPLAQTRTYDPKGNHITGRLLILDADLLSVGSVVNGDGTIISPNQYILRPVNSPPYFGISLKQRSGIGWTCGNNVNNAIGVSGTWGYATSMPEPVVQAATRLAAWLFRQRETSAAAGAAADIRLNASGSPSYLPTDIAHLLGPYVRLRMSVFNEHHSG